MFFKLINQINTQRNKLIKNRNRKKRNLLISKYREFDSYEPDIIKHKAESIYIKQKLPSEPPQGITYHFCATGYFTKNRNSDYCIIFTEWKNINNYCHWTFVELPLIYLALDSNSQYVVIPDVLLNINRPFQIRWWEILNRKFADKDIIALSRFDKKVNGIIPVNHDTSTSQKKIGKCDYKHYHHARATPYCIDLYSRLRNEFLVVNTSRIPNFYINRKTRRLKNEMQVQEFLINSGFQILNLEDYNLDEQVMLFSSAKFIIGFHGAGLSNLVFSTENTSVIEIVDKDCVYPSYKDGLVKPGRKATRTYFHMVSHMKSLNYACLESDNYYLSIDKLKDKIVEMR